MTTTQSFPHGELFIEADVDDPRFNEPYVDLREWRDEPADAPLFPGAITTHHGGPAPFPARHLYVHGGFTGTDAKFSFCFPPADDYQGRFFQTTHQLLASEEATARNVAFALASGAYSVQTNMGGSENPRTADDTADGKLDTTIRGYRVNAAAAKYSRVVAEEIYGPHRTYGYLYGGSGGSFQTISGAEMSRGVWDGFVPYVMGGPYSNPANFTVRVHALRVLKDKLPAIIDALEPGGSGDPYAGLNDEEREALEEATRMGFPPGAWFNFAPQGGGPLVLVAALVPRYDPTYLDDFWSKPGYLGTDPASSVSAARVQHDASVLEVTQGFPAQLRLSSVPTADLTGADVVITSGAVSGQTIMLGKFVSDGKGSVGLVFESVNDTIDVTADLSIVAQIKPGDEIRIDNSRFLALQTYHRHMLPPKKKEHDYPDVYDYFRDTNGEPRYPQRPVDVGEASCLGATGHIPTGLFHGRMIVVECTHDGDALPWQADWYRQRVEAEGSESDFRLWYVDKANHTDPTTDRQQTHAVPYSGVVQYALRAVAAWVEDGVAPPATSGYDVTGGQVKLPSTANGRNGVQPVVALDVNGSACVQVAVGETVRFTAHAEVPPNTGQLVSASWDFEGDGTYPERADLDGAASGSIDLVATHAYDTAGTFFPAIWVASQREGDSETPFARAVNLVRARVIVKG